MTTPSQTISLAQLEAMRQALAALAPKPKDQFTSREAIAAMAGEIRHARTELGYSLEDLARMLQPHGLAVRPGTLRGYLRALETKDDAAGKTRAPTRQPRRSPAPHNAASTNPASATPPVIVREDLPDPGQPDEDTDTPFRKEPPHGAGG